MYHLAALHLKRQLRLGGYKLAATNLQRRIEKYGLPLECAQGVTIRVIHDVSGPQLVAENEIGITVCTEEEVKEEHEHREWNAPRPSSRRSSKATMRNRTLRMSDELWQALDYQGDRAETARTILETALRSLGKLNRKRGRR